MSTTIKPIEEVYNPKFRSVETVLRHLFWDTRTINRCHSITWLENMVVSTMCAMCAWKFTKWLFEKEFQHNVWQAYFHSAPSIFNTGCLVCVCVLYVPLTVTLYPLICLISRRKYTSFWTLGKFKFGNILIELHSLATCFVFILGFSQQFFWAVRHLYARIGYHKQKLLRLILHTFGANPHAGPHGNMWRWTGGWCHVRYWWPWLLRRSWLKGEQ